MEASIDYPDIEINYDYSSLSVLPSPIKYYQKSFDNWEVKERVSVLKVHSSLQNHIKSKSVMSNELRNNINSNSSSNHKVKIQESNTSFNPLTATIRNNGYISKYNDYEVKLINKSKLFLNDKLNKERSYHKFNKSLNVFNHKGRAAIPLETINWNGNQEAIRHYGRFNELSKLYYESKNNIKLPLK